MRWTVLIGVLALTACGPSPDDAPVAGSGDDVLPESDVALAGPTMDLVRAMRSEDQSVRLNAAHALSKSGDPAAAPALLRQLADKDLYVRKAVAEALGCVLEPTPSDTAARSAAYKALSALLQDNDMSMRYQAVDSFARLRDRRAVPLLIKVLNRDRDEMVRGHAAFALGEIADPAAFDALKGALKDDGNSWKVSYAIAALAKDGDERASRLLLDALARRKYSMITGAGEFFVTQSGREIDQHLIEMLRQSHETTLNILLARHPSPAVAAAAQALGASADPEGAVSYGHIGC